MSCVRVLTRDTDVGFLSVRLSVRPSVQFRQKSAGKIGSLASCLSKSLRVIESYMHLSGTYDFLLVIHSNYGPTSYSCTISEINGHFCRKKFPPPLFYNGVLILKNYNAEKSLMICTLYNRFDRISSLEGRMDRRTDRNRTSISRVSILTRRVIKALYYNQRLLLPDPSLSVCACACVCDIHRI